MPTMQTSTPLPMSTLLSMLLVVPPFAAPTLAAAAARAPAPPVTWTSVAKTDRQEAFVDAASRRDRDGYVEAAVKYEYAEPQPYGKKSFRSARNVYTFDCANRRLADRENRVYAEPDLQGKAVASASRGAKNLVWRDAVPGTVDGVVLDYVCTKLGAGSTIDRAAPADGRGPAPGAANAPPASAAKPRDSQQTPMPKF